MSRSHPTRAQQVSRFVEDVRHQLIVSCQALPGEPLHGAEIMARMALAAQQGGAKAIRSNGPDDIRAIRAAVDLSIIGLYKDNIPGYPVYITPTLEHVHAIAAAGADIIAIDATQRLLLPRNIAFPTPYSAGSQHCHSVASAGAIRDFLSFAVTSAPLNSLLLGSLFSIEAFARQCQLTDF